MTEQSQSTTPLEDNRFDAVFVAEPSNPTLPPSSGRANREPTADAVAVDACGSYNHTPPAPYKPAPHSSSDEDGSSSTPTPPLSPPPAGSMDDTAPPIEPPSLALPPPSPITRPQPSPSTFSSNPVGDMFSPPLDKAGVIAVIGDILCSQRVINDRRKAVGVFEELESGCISGESMEWMVRGLRTVRGKRELKQRHGGLVFVGPRWGAPVYKTRKGIRRLLHGVSGGNVCTHTCYSFQELMR